jgi:hypothetical protein
MIASIKSLFHKKAPVHQHEWKYSYSTGDALAFEKRARVYQCSCGKFGLQEYGKGSFNITELK